MRRLVFLTALCVLSGSMCTVSVAGTVTDVNSEAFFSQMIARSAEQYELLLDAAEKEQTDKRPFPKRFQNGKRVYIGARDWCGGFFPGSLWLLYQGTGDAKWRDAAERWTKKLEQIRHYNGSHDIGFMLMTSYGNALRLTGNQEYEDVLRDGAAALITRYRAQADVIQSWDAWNKKRCPVIIDNMMNLELLQWAYKHPAKEDKTRGAVFDGISRQHSDTTDRNHFRADGSAYHVLDYDPTTGQIRGYYAGQGYDAVKGVWSRGHAWSVYGFTMMYRETKDPRYLARAIKSANWALGAANVPEDRIPFWDYKAPKIPNEPRDTAAAAVLSSALVELATFTEGSQSAAYRKEAETILASLSTLEYFAKKGENGFFLIKHSTGSFPANSEVDVPLNYTDYYFLETLLRIRKGVNQTK